MEHCPTCKLQYKRNNKFCEACKKDININTKSSHIKSATDIENEIISRINKNLTDKT